MATVELEGFDQYGTPSTGSASTYLAQGGWIVGGSSPPVTIVNGLSSQGYALALGSSISTGASLVTKQLFTSYSRLVGGFSFNSTLGVNVGCTFLDASTAQLSIMINYITGILTLFLGALTSGNTPFATSSVVVTANVSHSLEFDITFGAGINGGYSIWLDGVLVLSGTGTTIESANSFANNFQLATYPSFTEVNDYIIDDLYIFDSTTLFNNSVLLSRTEIVTQFPIADEQAQFSIHAGGTLNYQCVELNPPIGDTSSVIGTSATTEDLYYFPSVPTNVTNVYSVGISGNSRQTVANANTINLVVKSSTSHSFGSIAGQTPLTTYDWYDSYFDEDPNTSVSWTLSGLSNSYGGMEINTATSGSVYFDGIVRKLLCSAIPGTGPIPVFPSLPAGFPVKFSPLFDTVVGTIKSLREMRVAQRTNPLWDIEVPFEELRDQTQNQTPYEPFVYPTVYQEYEELVQTWLMMYGQSNVFAFDCPWDDSRSNQSIGIGDGQTYIFTVIRTWGTGAQATSSPVGMVNTVTQVTLNGTPVSSSEYYVSRNKIYFIGSNGQIYPPGNGVAIAMTFSFYYVCRFIEDEQDFEEFGKNRWRVPSLKFRAVYWP